MPMHHEWIRNELDERGYAVIPDLYTHDECVRLRRRFRALTRRLCKKEGMPYSVENLCRLSASGIMSGADQDEVLWEIRSHPRIREIFQGLLGNKIALLIDRYQYRPNGYKCDKMRPWWHWDLSPDKSHECPYQGFVSLTRTGRDDCGLGILEGSHDLDVQARFFRDNSMPPSMIMRDKELAWWNKEGVHPVRVLCPEGSFVIWSSRCVHSPLNSLTTPMRERIVIYARYAPRKKEEEKGHRQEALQT